uniref:C2H2-type domain-containing protein n=1 Tax=Neobodo designis TaxID=312471 RepID=A0A7S1M9F1_NEODS|mmetsp:Transcript_3664/g.11534  ORF Transcript_3664/g.11534 Transcript_3664/m.11534 type:complete len:332 (+) Transcript_3664:51-1046(+)|eukprot:CAMPEP_0174845154 /NCGR_PEP_ID=MMETSP1114-20130205/11550_1 /TAXON_ID=312471 /ORGANISM="Neobodo designis, Strain CCAP 1951/1" /LENGTH=331 /DNA_ID=CAMNT_0016079401 /DNA_START=48 /DNA_END=1043 /DNA_ORIENTATION=+
MSQPGSSSAPDAAEDVQEPAPRPVDSTDGSLQPGQLECSVCQKRFSGGPGARSNLLRHMRTHSGERTHPCPHCSSAFTTLQNLRRHIAAKHPGAPVPATRANSRAASRAGSMATTPVSMGAPTFSFPVHVSTETDAPAAPTSTGQSDPTTSPAVASPAASTALSTTSRPHACPHCDRTFTYNTSLRYHIRQAHPEELAPPNTDAPPKGLEVECPNCFALLSSRPKLNRHLQKHCVFRHEAPERRRNRDADGIALFEDDDSVASQSQPRHSVEAPEAETSSKRKRHRCNHDGCFATFATRRALREHQARSHLSDPAAESDARAAAAHITSPT